jgi:hypothetical protein
MKSYYVLGVLLVLSLLLTGCDSGNGDEEDKIESGFIGGTSGLVLRWYTPEQGYFTLLDNGNDEILLELQVENLGEADVPANKATISLSGISSRDFSLQKNDLTQKLETDLRGMFKLNDEKRDGDQTVVSFGPIKYIPQISTDITMPVIAEVCYPYKTSAEAVLCISEDPVDSNVCEPNGDRPVYSSGAPIQITDFTQQSAGKNTFIITFTIKHAGNGEIFKSGEGCDSQDFSSQGIVNVKVGNKEDWGWNSINVDCNGNPVGEYFTQRLRFGDESTVRCTVEVTDSMIGDYVRALPIELEYDYSSSVSTTLRVQSSSGSGE